VHLAIFGQPFDSQNFRPIQVNGQAQARVHRQTIYVDGASAALPLVAASMRAHQAQFIPQHIQQGTAGIKIQFVSVAIYGQGNEFFHSS
jgi:hypothetical protein